MDENGKWIPEYIDGKRNIQDEYTAKGTKDLPIVTFDDLFNVMQLVENTRSAKGHALNHRSSRSHCIVTLKCTRKSGSSMTKSNFLFVDLAGSERINKSGSTALKALEATTIN